MELLDLTISKLPEVWIENIFFKLLTIITLFKKKNKQLYFSLSILLLISRSFDLC